MTNPNPNEAEDAEREELKSEIFKIVAPHSFGFQGAKSYAAEIAMIFLELLDAQKQKWVEEIEAIAPKDVDLSQIEDNSIRVAGRVKNKNNTAWRAALRGES